MPHKKSSLSNSSSRSSLRSQAMLSMARQSRFQFQQRQMSAQGHDGSGRDTFIIFAPHGADKPIYTSGFGKKTFENGLRETANYMSTPTRPTKRKTPVGKWVKYRKGKTLFDEMLEKGIAFGSAPKINSTDYNAGHGVAALIKGGKEHQFEDHLTPGRRAIHAKRPKSASTVNARLAKTHILRRNMNVYKGAGERLCPKKKRQEDFLKKSRARQENARGYERHTCGRIHIGKKKND